ncbi:MAG: hypothetical protein ACJ79H_04895 [Myxococcales bacterium]
MRLSTLPIFLAFFVMGVADAMGPLAEAVRKSFGLSNVLATLLPFFVFIAFAVFSVPAGVLGARIGGDLAAPARATGCRSPLIHGRC